MITLLPEDIVGVKPLKSLNYVAHTLTHDQFK